MPPTVNTNGGLATQLAWRNLFARVVLIICFLKIRDHCQWLTEHF